MQKNYAMTKNHQNKARQQSAIFFGAKDFSSCIQGIEDAGLYARALNLLSHGQYSIYEPREMIEDNKVLFKKMYDAFIARYRFELPEITRQKETVAT